MSYKITTVGLEHDKPLSQKELEDIAIAAAEMGNSRLWVLADAMDAILSDDYKKDKYAHFIELTQCSAKRLYQIRKVARVYPIETRRKEFSFCVHDFVAQHFGYTRMEEAQALMLQAANEQWPPKKIYRLCRPHSENCNNARFRGRLVMLDKSAKRYIGCINDLTYSQVAQLLGDMEHLQKLYQSAQARMLYLINASDGEQDSKMEAAIKRLNKKGKEEAR